MTLSDVDGAVLLIMLLSGVVAFAHGMVREVLSLAGWVLAALAVLYGSPMALP